MKNKGFKITALILTLAISIIAHPFLVINAATYTYQTSGTVGYFNYRMNLYGSDNIHDLVIDGTTYSGASILVYEFYSQYPCTGYFTVMGNTSINMNNYRLFCYGGKLTNYGGPGSANGRYRISFSNVTYIKLILVSDNMLNSSTSLTISASGSDADMHEATSDELSTLNEIDIKLGDQNNILQDIDYALRNTLNYLYINVNYNSYINESYNTSSHYKQFDSNTDINEIRIEGTSTNFIKRNYFIFQVSLYSRTARSDNSFNFNNYYIGLTDLSPATVLTNDQHYDYIFIQEYNDDPLDLRTLYTVTFYIPSYLIRSTQAFNISIYNIDVDDVSDLYVSYIGTVETLPDIKADNHADDKPVEADNLNNQTQQLENINQQAQQIEQQNNQALNNFQLQVNPNNYYFDISNEYPTQYFKMRLEDIYNVSDLRPFYIIPVILFVLLSIMGG